jgi:hypothetical protein
MDEVSGLVTVQPRNRTVIAQPTYCHSTVYTPNIFVKKFIQVVIFKKENTPHSTCMVQFPHTHLFFPAIYSFY